MAFNLNSWKYLTKSKGYLRPWSYEIFVTPPVSPDALEIRLRTESITLPGAAFLSADNYRPYATGLNFDIPYAMNISDITCTHMIDGNADIVKTFYEWASLVSDMKGESGKFSANYFKEYVVDMTIKVYTESKELAKTYTVYNVYPKAIDQLSMSWTTTDDVVRLGVTYFFTHYKLN
jgi:hypothetical protein